MAMFVCVHAFARALRSFESGDLTESREYLELQPDRRHSSRDPEVFPLWDPGQLLSTSHTLLVKSATLQAGTEEGSGSDDATSVASDGDYGSRWVMSGRLSIYMYTVVMCQQWMQAFHSCVNLSR